jgi:lysophospholipid acyltransferase (LPLAT)-like uncharacterized protein
MKIRHLWLIKVIGWLGAWVIRGWGNSLRFSYLQLGPNVRPRKPGANEKYIYIFWHENLMPAAYWWRRCGAHVLVSEHADGQIIATVCKHLGYGIVAGSSTRGGVRAIKQMVQRGQQAHLAITPDGPRGPRRHLQPGLVYLASRTGMRVVPLGIGMQRPWRLGSWDRFALPKPGSRGRAIIGEPIRVPPDISSAELEMHRRQIEGVLNQVSELAEGWAETGKPPQIEQRQEIFLRRAA